ncbi:MAG: hypothetical protein AAB227_05140 [Pseudomonadota bacterium]
MRAIAILAVAAFSSFSAARAGAPEGYEPFYDAPTRVNMGGRPVTANIELYTDRALAKKGDLRVALVTDVTDFIVDVEKDLEKWVATHQDECGQRWNAGKPIIDFPDGAIRFALDIELAVWNCGWDGKGEPGRMMLETGKIDVTLIPAAVDGKLQASLGDLSITDRSGVSKFLPLEFITQSIIEQELKKLNENPKFYKAPKPFLDEGFVYESISGDTGADKRVIITARYRAKGKESALKKLADRVRSEGIRAEGVKK